MSFHYTNRYSLHFGLPMFMAERRDVSYERAQQIRQQQQADPLLQVYFDGHSDDLSESADLDLNEEAQWVRDRVMMMMCQAH